MRLVVVGTRTLGIPQIKRVTNDEIFARTGGRRVLYKTAAERRNSRL